MDELKENNNEDNKNVEILLAYAESILYMITSSSFINQDESGRYIYDRDAHKRTFQLLLSESGLSLDDSEN